MKLLKEIKDAEFPEDQSELKIREASRAILFDENNLIPILFVSNKKYHKLPGGGIENGENKEEALERECLEEVGSKIEINGEVGKTIEYRSKWNLKQTSFCYHGKILSKGNPNFTKKEINDGFQVLWLKLNDAISKIENDNPEDYQGKFIKERDLIFLKTFEKDL